jgi:cytochrome P450
MDTVVQTYDEDLFTRDAVRDPYPHYRALRELGPVVRLSAHGVDVVSRYADVRAVLADAKTFISGEGIGFDDEANQLSRGKTLTSDDPLHAHLRKVVAHRLLPRALRDLDPTIDKTAEHLVDDLGGGGTVEAMSQIAQMMPLTVVPEFLGLPEDCRDNLLPWAGASIDTLGPAGERTSRNLGLRREMMGYAADLVRDRRLAPGSVGDDLLAAADRGDLAMDQCPALMIDYLGPSVETTVAAIGNALALFARNPDQWARLRADPALVAGSFAEAIRLESPLRGFTRITRHDTEISGVPVAAGTRVWVLFASANRDERKWDRAEEFDIGRSNLDHVALGYGIHACPGQGLARKEFSVLLTKLARRFARIELAGEPEWSENNILRSYRHLPLRLVTD